MGSSCRKIILASIISERSLENVKINNCQFQTLPSKVFSNAVSSRTAHSYKLLNLRKLNLISFLVIICFSPFSQENSVEIKKDTEREDEIKAIKAAWETVEPGRSVKVRKTRSRL